MGRELFQGYQILKEYQFWPQEIPTFAEWATKWNLFGFVGPSGVQEAGAVIEELVLRMQDNAEMAIEAAKREESLIETEDQPIVYAQLRDSLLKDQASKKDKNWCVHNSIEGLRLGMASEMMDHVVAGFDTSSITLLFLTWELSLPSNKRWQDKLGFEIASLGGSLDPRPIDQLPILHAILLETLRLHAPVPGNQPRITPSGTHTTLGPSTHTFAVPPDVRVQAQAWSLHRNSSVFPDPERWNPGRWLESTPEQLEEMQRWFWAFGSGGRMCIANNFAMLVMKAIMVAIWREFRTRAVDVAALSGNSTLLQLVGTCTTGIEINLSFNKQGVWKCCPSMSGL
ncbi:hypothetical protein B0A55_12702 [Friedmanniomyces simplex]|uniref:Cytochrome P450 n=1 Tax=Friedmanniomyces simplex TaxID=329884 RepID=A0A4U0WKU1_9PEZI|nr:hypothetical protein B0A55_12702 [Friedmanniomyces simplex]